MDEQAEVERLAKEALELDVRKKAIELREAERRRTPSTRRERHAARREAGFDHSESDTIEESTTLHHAQENGGQSASTLDSVAESISASNSGTRSTALGESVVEENVSEGRSSSSDDFEASEIDESGVVVVVEESTASEIDDSGGEPAKSPGDSYGGDSFVSEDAEESRKLELSHTLATTYGDDFEDEDDAEKRKGGTYSGYNIRRRF